MRLNGIIRSIEQISQFLTALKDGVSMRQIDEGAAMKVEVEYFGGNEETIQDFCESNDLKIVVK